jgi:double-stranded uracil-DNA glycosylase
MPRTNGLAAIIPPHPRILILGSFPGVESLTKQEYYANGTNRFWKLIGTIFAIESLTELPYMTKLTQFESSGIALWDVVTSCERKGSLDSRIRNPEWNDIPQVLAENPSIEKIFLNGSTASRLFSRAARNWTRFPAPAPLIFECLSTSAANQRYGPWDKLVEDWSQHLLMQE